MRTIAQFNLFGMRFVGRGTGQCLALACLSLWFPQLQSTYLWELFACCGSDTGSSCDLPQFCKYVLFSHFFESACKCQDLALSGIYLNFLCRTFLSHGFILLTHFQH